MGHGIVLESLEYLSFVRGRRWLAALQTSNLSLNTEDYINVICV